ncbi:MAG: DUF1128 domain-containing protein [Paenibacillaceae bacterium]
MDLTKNTIENADYIIDAIKTKLRMASGAALSAKQFDLELYEDLKDIYDLVQSKPYFSVSEMDAIVLELGRLRKPTN